MTTKELVLLIEELLQGELDNADVGRIADEDCVAVDMHGDTWFIEIKEG